MPNSITNLCLKTLSSATEKWVLSKIFYKIIINGRTMFLVALNHHTSGLYKSQTIAGIQDCQFYCFPNTPHTM
jgi:hypothetical protein